MTSETMTTRLTEDLVKEIEVVSRTEHLDKSEVMRRLLADSLERWRIERALELYKKGAYSFGQAVRFAHVSPWRFTDLMREHKIHLSLDTEDINMEFKSAGW